MRIALTHNLRVDRLRGRGRVRLARDDRHHRARARARRPPRRAVRRDRAGVAPRHAPRGVRARHRLQPRRGPPRQDAARVLPRALRGARHPLDGERRVHALRHARQGAHQEAARRLGRAEPARALRHAGDAEDRRARRAAVPRHREAELRGLEQGHRPGQRGRGSRSRSARVLDDLLDEVPRRRARRAVRAGHRRARRPRRGAAAAARRSRRSSIPAYPRRHDVLDYRLANVDTRMVAAPARPRACSAATRERLRDLASRTLSAFALRDAAALDFRVGADGEVWFLSATAIPSFAHDGALFAATRAVGLDYDATVLAVLRSAAVRHGLTPLLDATRPRPARARRTSLRVGLAFNMKRIDSHAGDDREAEYDAPETIQAITAGHREPRPRRRPARGDARLPARAHGVERRRRLQHRRGDGRTQPRGAGAEPLRAARRPVHRQRLGDALDLPRQGARQAAPRRRRHARVPGARHRAARSCGRSATRSS